MKEKHRRTTQIVIFVLITTFIFVGPAYRQVFGGKNEIFRNWVMWSGKGIGLFDLKLYKANDTGKISFINYRKELKIKGNSTKNRRLKKLRRKADVREVVKLICNKYPGTNIQMNLRLSRKEGWKTVYNKDTNICFNPNLLRF